LLIATTQGRNEGGKGPQFLYEFYTGRGIFATFADPPSHQKQAYQRRLPVALNLSGFNL